MGNLRYGSNMKIDMVLGNKLLVARREAGLRQLHVAEKLGASNAIVCRIEHGMRPLSLAELSKILGILAVDIKGVEAFIADVVMRAEEIPIVVDDMRVSDLIAVFRLAGLSVDEINDKLLELILWPSAA